MDNIFTMDPANSIPNATTRDEDEKSQEDEECVPFSYYEYEDEGKQKPHPDPEYDMPVTPRRPRRPGLAEEDTVCTEETSVTPVSQRPGAHAIPGESGSTGIDVETEITSSNPSTLLLSAHVVDETSIHQEVADLRQDLRQVVNTLNHQTTTQAVPAVLLHQGTQSTPVDVDAEENREEKRFWNRRLGMFLSIVVIVILIVIATVIAKGTSSNDDEKNSSNKQDFATGTASPSLRVTPPPTLSTTEPSPDISPDRPSVTQDPTSQLTSQVPSIDTLEPTPETNPTVLPTTEETILAPPTTTPEPPDTVPPTTETNPTMPPTSEETFLAPPTTTPEPPDTIPPTTSPESPAPPAELNDSCETAIGPLHPGDVVNGNTTGAQTTDLYDSIASCTGSGSTRSSPRLWYIVVGTGNRIAASMCDDFPEDNDLRLTVFFANNCDEYECIETSTSNDFDGCSGGSYAWDSILGRTYYVLIHGEYSYNDGAFVLRVGEVPTNGMCLDAEEIALPSTIQGDTYFATRTQPYAATCPEDGSLSIQRAGGIWYIVNVADQDQGLHATVSCPNDAATDVDCLERPHVTIFSGPCDALYCVNATNRGEDYYWYEASVLWHGNAGGTYYIHVFGYSSSRKGRFSLSLGPTSVIVPSQEPVSAPINELCANAIGPLTAGIQVTGSTSGASNSHAPECGDASSQIASSVWYIVEGTGRSMVISTCSGVSDFHENEFYRQISVFIGSCENLECVTGEDYDYDGNCYGGPAIVEWESILGEIYYVLIHGEYLGSSGTFFLNLGTRPSNDYCVNATSLTVDSVIQGSTFFAHDESDKSNCYGDIFGMDSPTVWYSFQNQQAVDQAVVATTCIEGHAPSSVPVEIAIFQGSCDELVCIGVGYWYPEEFCSSHEAGFEWVAEHGKIYYIAVHHGIYDFYFGNFSLVVQETEMPVLPPQDTPPNDLCTGAKSLAAGEFDVASTLGAHYDRDVWEDMDAPGVWYEFIGTGEELIVAYPYYGFNVRIFDGSNCNELEVIFTSYSWWSSGLYKYRYFDSVASVKYFVVISGSKDGFVGDYFVILTTRWGSGETWPSGGLVPPATTLRCSQSIQLEFDSIVEGNTSLGYTNRWIYGGTVSTYCGINYHEHRSVWYSFRSATSEVVIASTCTGIPEHDVSVDTRVSVFQFENEELVCHRLYYCVDWNDDDPNDFCIGEASVTWTAEANRTYKIVVSSPADDVGQYYLVLRRAE